MSQHVKYRELRIEIQDGIILVIDVTTKDEVITALSETADLKLSTKAAHQPKEKAAHHEFPPLTEDTPETIIEVRAGLSAGTLRSKSIVAFKDGIPQLLKPNAFSSNSDAALTLLYAVEIGLKKSSISFTDYKSLYDAQNIKSGTPLSMLLNNLKNSGYVDKNKYTQDRTICLTAKGEKKTVEVLTNFT